MRYIVQGNYSKFRVTLTQKSGELIIPYVPTGADEVEISLYGARRYEYSDYEQSGNVLTFVDNGYLKVDLYALEVKIVESTTRRLRCMYREQLRVVASNDDIPSDASFSDDDIQLSGQFDIAASVEIVVDDALSLTSPNPVQNKVVTAALNSKAEKLEIASVQVGVQLSLKRGDVVLSNAILHFAGLTLGKGGLMSAYDYSKLAALPTNAALTTALAGKEDKVAIEAPVNSVDATQPITTLTTEVGKYYRIDVAVETLATTLPAMTDSTKIANVVLMLTGGTTPAVTIASTAPSGGTAPDVYYQDGFAIEARKTYEVNCLWNGAAWVVAAVEIVIS